MNRLTSFSRKWSLIVSWSISVTTFCFSQTPGSEDWQDHSREELEKLVFEIYQEKPHKAISILKYLSSQADLDTKKKTTYYLNTANVFDEQLLHYDSALKYAGYGLALATETEDLMQRANLLKYVGYLQGRLHLFEEGKASIQASIDLYRQVYFQQGRMVATQNLASLYLEAEEYEQALTYFKEANEFWRRKQLRSRLFKSNLQGIQIAIQLDDRALARSLIEENQKMLPDLALDSVAKSKFQSLSDKIEK